jgi:hypothetical protein
MPKAKIFSLTSVMIHIQKSNPPKALIIVLGTVTTNGWSAPELRTTGPELSADGILDLEFVAEPPPAGSIILPMTIPMKAEIVWENDVDRLIGTKVYSRTNDIVRLVHEPDLTTMMVGEEQWPPPGWPPKIPTTFPGAEEHFPTPKIGEPPKWPIAGGEKWPFGEKLPIGETSPMTDDPAGPGDFGPVVNPGNPGAFGRR